MAKFNFQLQTLLQSSVSIGPSEIWS